MYFVLPNSQLAFTCGLGYVNGSFFKGSISAVIGRGEQCEVSLYRVQKFILKVTVSTGHGKALYVISDTLIVVSLFFHSNLMLQASSKASRKVNEPIEKLVSTNPPALQLPAPGNIMKDTVHRPTGTPQHVHYRAPSYKRPPQPNIPQQIFPKRLILLAGKAHSIVKPPITLPVQVLNNFVPQSQQQSTPFKTPQYRVPMRPALTSGIPSRPIASPVSKPAFQSVPAPVAGTPSMQLKTATLSTKIPAGLTATPAVPASPLQTSLSVSSSQSQKIPSSPISQQAQVPPSSPGSPGLKRLFSLLPSNPSRTATMPVKKKQQYELSLNKLQFGTGQPSLVPDSRGTTRKPTKPQHLALAALFRLLTEKDVLIAELRYLNDQANLAETQVSFLRNFLLKHFLGQEV